MVLRSDVERKTVFGRQEDEKLPQDAYSPRMTARVYAAIIDKARRAVAAGHSAIVDAVFATPPERAPELAAYRDEAYSALSDLLRRLRDAPVDY